jgi:hypothetical protein
LEELNRVGVIDLEDGLEGLIRVGVIEDLVEGLEELNRVGVIDLEDGLEGLIRVGVMEDFEDGLLEELILVGVIDLEDGLEGLIRVGVMEDLPEGLLEEPSRKGELEILKDWVTGLIVLASFGGDEDCGDGIGATLRENTFLALEIPFTIVAPSNNSKTMADWMKMFLIIFICV